MIDTGKIFGGLVYTTAAVVVALAGGFIYSIFFEEPFLSYKNVPFIVHGQTIPGGPAASPVIRCSSSNKTEAYRTTRNFQKMGANQSAMVLPSVDVTVEPGCEPAISRVNIVPDGTLPGYYRFTGVASVEGMFITHKVSWGTAFFEVVAKPPAPASAPAPAPVAAPAAAPAPALGAASGAAAVPLLLPIANATIKIEVKK